MPEFSQVVSVLGPAGAVVLWILINREKAQPSEKGGDHDKTDAMHSMLVEILTILRERKG